MNSHWKEKIKSLSELSVIIKERKTMGQKIAQCHGVFDFLHRGHLHQFEQAKTKTDILIVSLTADGYVLKGPGRPVFNQQIRSEMLAALELVDFVTVVESASAIETIKLLRPDYYVKGQSYEDSTKDITGKIVHEDEAVRSVGGEILFTHEMPIRSTPLLNSYIDPYPQEVLSYLTSFKKKYSFSNLVEMIKRFQDLRILLIGETIIDQYDYVQPMDVSPKGHVIASRHLNSELFAGGILACANHMASFCSTIDVVSTVGSLNSHRGFISGSLAENIRTWFLTREGSETIIKKRQVENNYFQKQSETYHGDDSPLQENEELAVLEYLRNNMAKYDLVFVLDYGHGLMTKNVVDLVSGSKRNPKLALNVQVNSANKGFNLVTKYPRANFISLDKFEIQIAFSDRDSDPQHLAEKLAQRLDASLVAVTLGKHGSIVSDGKNCYSTPVFSKKVVDTVGAGDAYFSLAALSYIAGFDPELAGFIGNMAGALATTYIGNKASVTKSSLLNFAQTLLS